MLSSVCGPTFEPGGLTPHMRLRDLEVAFLPLAGGLVQRREVDEEAHYHDVTPTGTAIFTTIAHVRVVHSP